MSQLESDQEGASAVSQAQEKAQEKVQEVKSQAGGQVRQQIDSRSTQAGEQVSSVAGALRRTADQLREEGQERPSQLLEKGAERANRFGGYLTQVDGDALLGDVEAFARRRPWALAAGAAAAGFAAARFLGASSRRRYESGAGYEYEEPYRRVPSPGAEAYGEIDAGSPWRGPDAKLADEARQSTSGQPF
jgi:gas vesicle protein